MSGSLRTDGTNALGPGTPQINMAAALPQSRCASVIAIVATDVDPSRSIWRPRPAPAAVIGGVGVGHTNTNERKAMVAVMEEPAVMGKPCMRKTWTREAATCEHRPGCLRSRRGCLRNPCRRHACRRPCHQNAFHLHPHACRHHHDRHRRHPMPPPPPPPPPRASTGDASASAAIIAPTMRHLRSLLFIPTSVLNCSDQYGRRKEHNQQTQMIQSFQMNNATVSDTEVSFAVSLYEACRRFSVAAALR